jgi:hypothetical protein
LRTAKITNVLDYLIAPSEKIATIPKLTLRLIEDAKEEIREGVKSGYIDPDKVIGASTFDWMDYRVTPKLRGRKISKIKDFINTPSEKIVELSELNDNLISKSKIKLNELLSDYNDSGSLLQIPELQESMYSDLNRLNIHGFIDFLLTNEKELQIVRGFVDNLIQEKQGEIISEINENFDTIPIKRAYWLDLDLEKELSKLGITTIFDFISYPTKALGKIDGMDPQVLQAIKRTYGTPIPLLDKATIEKLEALSILCLEELISTTSVKTIKPKALADEVSTFLKQLNYPICYLPISSKYYGVLHHLGISKIINFLIWPDYDLHKKAEISYRTIEELKSGISLQEIDDKISEKSRSVTILSNNLKGKSWDTFLSSDLTVQEVYYNLPYNSGNFDKISLSKKEINSLIEVFNTPITRLSHIRPKWIENLRRSGIKSFTDLISWNTDELKAIIGREVEYVEGLTKEIPTFNEGMNLIDLGVFTASEMKILKSHGFSTVESVYFCAEKRTFGVMGVKWKKIERFQRILETPIAMIQLQGSSDSSQIRISHDGLERLAVNGIDQIIKLIYWPIAELKTILNMSVKNINDLKQAVAIKEHGMPLEHVAGYNRKTIATLLNYGIETVEDLYFSVNEDMLDEDDELEFTYVKKAVEALDLPITYLQGIIAPKYIEKLVTNRIDTFLRFLISSQKELSDILETPQENIENLRRKVNLFRMRESTETSVSIIEGLTRKQHRLLADENIISIYDFLTASDDQLTNILEMEAESINLMRQDLNFGNIKTIKEEKMIPLTKISLIDRNTVKKFAKYGIESLADLYYVVTPKTVEESEIEWQTIEDARIVLDLPVEISDTVTVAELKLLKKAKINSILDLMIDSLEKLNGRTGIEIDRIKKIQESIKINEVISLLKNLSVDIIVFPPDYYSLMKQKDIKFIYDLLNYKDDTLFLKKIKEKKVRVTTDLWIDAFTILSVPLNLILGADNDDMKLLKQKKIDTLRAIYSTDPQRLTTILQKSPNELLEELKTLNFREINQLLNIPISFIPKLPIEWLPILKSNSILQVGKLIQIPQNELVSMLSASFPKIRSVFNEITFSSMLHKLEEESVPLSVTGAPLPSSTIKKLAAKNITSVQSLILVDSEDKKLEGVSECLRILEGPINRLSEDLSMDKLRKLSHINITTLASWFYSPNDSLGTTLGMSTEEINNLKQNFNFESVGKVIDSETAISDVVESGYISFEELTKHGVTTLEDLLFIEIEPIKAEDKFKLRLNSLRDALNSSLAYYSLIPSSYVVPLAFNGITSVYQLIQTDFSDLDDDMGIIREDTYTMARSSINLVNIITHKKTESEFRVKLSSLRAFTSNQLLRIQEVGIDNVIDLYFRLDPDRCPKSVIPAVDGVKRVLEKPVAVLPLVKQSFPTKIPLLFNAGITSIIEFLFWDKDEVAEILEIKRYEISKYRKMNLSEMKRKKNLGTPIRNFVRIEEKYHDPLHEFGIDNVEDLYFYGKRYSDLIPDDAVPKKLINACVSDLETPIVKLADLPIPSAQELVKKGVNRIIDFLYWPEESLKNIHGLSAAKIKKIKSNIRLRRKTDVLGQLDSYMGG